jgi:hypothetical protein
MLCHSTRTDVSNAGAIGAAVKGFGDELSQQADAVIRARATEGLLDYQIKIKDVNESIRQGVEDGTIKADQIGEVIKQQFPSLKSRFCRA